MIKPMGKSKPLELLASVEGVGTGLIMASTVGGLTSVAVSIGGDVTVVLAIGTVAVCIGPGMGDTVGVTR